MLTQDLLPDELVITGGAAKASHPMDSSQMLLGLLSLSRTAKRDNDSQAVDDSLYGMISRGTLRTLVSALQFRDAATVLHSRRVANLAVGLAHRLGWDPPEQKILEIACLLHDIGKIGIPDHVLFKPGKLSPVEANLMALHHDIGIDVIQACRVDIRVIEYIAQTGLLDGRRDPVNTQTHGGVTQGARILAVADAYDSMSNDQVFREGKSHNEILDILKASVGKRFDGNVVNALARWIEHEGLPRQDIPDVPAGSEAGPSPAADSASAIQANFLAQVFSHLFMLESLYDGFFLLDADQRFVIWNQGAERTLQRPARQMLGQRWSKELLGYSREFGEPLPDEQCPMNMVASTRKPATSTMCMTRADGQSVEVELQSVPLIDQNGRLQGVAEIFRDLRRSERPSEYRELKLAASRDALTSVANRGELESQLEVMIRRFNNNHDAEAFSMIFLDVDFFKNVNDTFGHTVGDQVLVEVARLLQHETYSGELVGRYGGEEFVVLCPATDLKQAFRRAERLRLALPEARIEGVPNYQITASFGVTQVEPGDTTETIFQRADRALYQAKETGRNRTCVLPKQEGDEPEPDPVRDESPDPFLFTNTFHACVTDEMIVYKLGGFVTDQKARLGKVTPNSAEIQLGSRGLLPFWGSTPKKQPVRIHIEFRNSVETPGKQYAASRRSEVKVCVKPVGRVRDADVFQNRARDVMKMLRSYFVAD